jgi:peptide chain release factor 1
MYYIYKLLLIVTPSSLSSFLSVFHHSSAASVIVMPEAEELDVSVRPQDIRVDVFRAGGAGGQNVNRTESAVRMTHIATGITVAMQDERSQMQNRAKAMKILLARIYDAERRKMLEARSELRSAAQGTGDRSDKIRTYNFPQDRVSDHRISFTTTGIENIMSGNSGGASGLSDIIEALIESDKKERLNNLLEALNKEHSSKNKESLKKK